MLGAAPFQAAAHSFGRLYTLPVPVWMYLYGAAAALALSFLMIVYFVGAPARALRNFRTLRLPSACNVLRTPLLLRTLQALSLALLLLSIASGLIGSANSYANFNMTFFWIIVLLGYTYWCALFGNSYDLLNPWRAIIGALRRLAPKAFSGCRSYPSWLGYYPAVLLYMALVWLELFGNVHPLTLSVMLVVYTILSLAGAWWWGEQTWFRYCDFLGVLFRVVGRIAPLHWAGDGFRLRQPFIGLLEEPCPLPSLLVFILFMLSSTAFDGVHETVFWVHLYWYDVVNLLKPLVGADPARTYPLFKMLYLGFQSLALLASPLAYLSVYIALLWLARRLVCSRIPLRRLCLEFAYPLVPIAFVYNLTHYYTLALGQGPTILRLASDPFGYGWNLFGTGASFGSPLLLDAGTIWHTQVALILLGHIAGVYLAHLVALRLFSGARAATVSQLPVLILMMLYTTAGLWILSLPIQAGVWVPR